MATRRNKARRTQIWATKATAALLLALTHPAAHAADDDCRVVLGDPEATEVVAFPGIGAGAALASAGDLDLDGLDDWLVGAPDFSMSGSPPAIGAAALYLGSSDPAERIEPDILFVGEGAHDRAGTSVAGDFDFDGDGIPDLLIGAEQFHRPSLSEVAADGDLAGGCVAGEACGEGRVYLIFFRPEEYDLADPATDVVDLSTVGQPGGVSGVVLVGGQIGDRAGASVSGGGRMNEDLYDDIAIGAPGRDTAAGADAGTVFVLFGGPPSRLGRPLPGSLRLDAGAQSLGVIYVGDGAGDALGSAVAFPGDVVGSSGADLVMGAPGTDVLALDAGTVFGAAGGNAKRETIEACTLGYSSEGFQLHGSQMGEALGSAVAGGGDNLVDGQADLLIGAPGFDRGTAADAGRVAQTASKLPMAVLSIDSVGAGPGARESIAGVLYLGASAGDRLGSAVAGIEATAPGEADRIALGAPWADLPGAADSGQVYVRSGSPSPSPPTVVDVAAFPGVTFLGAHPGQRAGASLGGAGDLDADGMADFLIGAPGHPPKPDAGGHGRVFLVLEQPDDCDGGDDDDGDGDDDDDGDGDDD
ncbi:MAG: integrin alpha [Holophagales bacterium]|nr:integrin alpha [Holophagales bacterium]